MSQSAPTASVDATVQGSNASQLGIKITVTLNNPNSSIVSRSVGYALGSSQSTLNPFYVSVAGGEKSVSLSPGQSTVTFTKTYLNSQGVYLPFDLAVLVGAQGVNIFNKGLKAGVSKLPGKQYLDDYTFKRVSSL